MSILETSSQYPETKEKPCGICKREEIRFLNHHLCLPMGVQTLLFSSKNVQCLYFSSSTIVPLGIDKATRNSMKLKSSSMNNDTRQFPVIIDI